MEIAILRHGKPDAPAKKRISASAFIDLITDYNASSLSKSSVPTDNALSYANECGAIVCSNLKRSLDSAKALDKEKVILSDQLFVEAGLPSANWRLLKLSPSLWAVIFRVLWLFGYSNNSESIIEVKSRASQGVNELTELAQKHQRVLFVGHGVFNRLLVKELRTRNWSGPKNPGSTHWSFEVYEQ